MLNNVTCNTTTTELINAQLLLSACCIDGSSKRNYSLGTRNVDVQYITRYAPVTYQLLFSSHTDNWPWRLKNQRMDHIY